MSKSRIVNGLYRHIKSGRPYYVVGSGRLSERPERRVVVYGQLYESTLDASTQQRRTRLPMYSIWVRVRDMEEFKEKFRLMG